jgi:DNA polymerase-3 subunit chi
MVKISCYQTTQNQLPKAFCQLVEKCYYSNLRTSIFTENKNYRDELDRVLWTYSKKHFIPHATSSDPLPERQPVYITEDVTQYNKSEIIIFVKATRDTILKALADKNIAGSKIIQKIFFIFDEAEQTNAGEIKNLLEKSSFKEAMINIFNQTGNGGWQEVVSA